MSELERVEAAAGDRLRAQADGNHDAEAAAGVALQQAVAAAMQAGAELSDIVAGESAGRRRVREESQADALRRVSRAAVKAREAEAERDRQITRADRLGVPRRLVAEAAGCAPATIKATVTAGVAPSNGGAPAEADTDDGAGFNGRTDASEVSDERRAASQTNEEGSSL